MKLSAISRLTPTVPTADFICRLSKPRPDLTCATLIGLSVACVAKAAPATRRRRLYK